MVEAAHEKEVQAKQTIQKLKEEITNLNKLVEKGAGVSVDQEHRWAILYTFGLFWEFLLMYFWWKHGQLYNTFFLALFYPNHLF